MANKTFMGLGTDTSKVPKISKEKLEKHMFDYGRTVYGKTTRVLEKIKIVSVK